jgi:diguanylate cyclase (GGDEF)-like protein
MDTGKYSSQHVLDLEAELNNVTERSKKIDLLNEIAWHLHLRDPQKARGLVEQAYELASSDEFEKEPYLPGQAGSLRCQAALNDDTGSYEDALLQSLRALEILESLHEDKPDIQSMMLDTMGVISWTYRCLGDYGVAAEYAMKALREAQARGDRQHEAGMLNVLSVIYAESNDLNAALDIGEKVVQNCRERGFVQGESIALNNLSLTYLELGNGKKALETCLESLHLAREHGITRVIVTVLSTLGEIQLGIKDYPNAENSLLEALELARQHKAGSDEFQCLLNLGKVHRCLQNDETALSEFQEALALSQASGDRRGESQCHQLLSEVFEKRGELGTALEHFKQFHALKESVLNEDTANRLAGLKVAQQVETAKREAEINYLKTIELKQEIEERIKAQAALLKLATFDALTGMMNRREFFVLGEREIEHILPGEQPLTAILFDLDHFKRINDIYGHAIGDQVLVQISRIISEILRQGEVVGRYGGDEFAILLPGSNGAQGKQVAERLREKIASNPIATPKGDIPVTLSLGIAELRETKSQDLDSLMEFADQALYAAKRAGRNRSAIYTELNQNPLEAKGAVEDGQKTV